MLAHNQGFPKGTRLRVADLAMLRRTCWMIRQHLLQLTMKAMSFAIVVEPET